MSWLVPYFFRFFAEHQLEKKYLIVPSYQTGHQIGEALAKESEAWVNLHFVTLPSLAQETAGIVWALRHSIFALRTAEWRSRDLKPVSP